MHGHALLWADLHFIYWSSRGREWTKRDFLAYGSSKEKMEPYKPSLSICLSEPLPFSQESMDLLNRTNVILVLLSFLWSY